MKERMVNQEIDFSPHISRRNILKIGAVATGSYFASKIAIPIAEQKYDEWLANMSNAEFLRAYKEPISHMHFGASFSPEKFGIHKDRHGQVAGDMGLAMEGFQFMIDTLNLKHIRLGIMWENAVDETGGVDLSLYQPFIDYGLSHGVKFCKNFGYKSLRWPEQHPPAWVDDAAMLAFGSTVTQETQIGQEALQYTNNMANYLGREYGREITMVQPENEPFQKFGEYNQDLAHNYMETSIGIVRGALPHAKVLINAGGEENIKKVIPFINRLTDRKPELRNQIVSGIDIHLDNPKMNPLWKKIGLDTMTVDKIEHGDVYDWHKTITKKNNIPTEGTELQIEGYGSEQSPLYSIKKLRKSLIRCFNVLYTDKTDLVSTLRFWGPEDQYKVVKFQGISPETQKRLELIQILTSHQAS